jgi:hypothetical protein
MANTTGDIIESSFLGEPLTSANWHKLKQKLLAVAYSYFLNDFPLGFIGFLASAAEWRLFAGMALVPQPVLPDRQQVPAPSDGTAAGDRRYDVELKAGLRVMELRKEIVEVMSKFKAVLLNKAIVGVHYAIALGAGDEMELLTDTPQAIFARLEEHLGTPDYKTFHTWNEVYRRQMMDGDVLTWILDEAYAHNLLAKHGKQLTDSQRLSAVLFSFRLSPAVMVCWVDYCKTNPTEALRNFTDFLAYIKVQEPNIREAMTKQDIGYVPMAALTMQIAEFGSAAVGAAAGEEERMGSANAAAAPRTYSQAQLDSAVAEALARGNRSDKPVLYCWLHGYQSSHKGLECSGIQNGAPIRHKRDSRAPLPGTMVFGRSGCISKERANEAAGPTTVPTHPGNAIRPGDKPYAA